MRRQRNRPLLIAMLAFAAMPAGAETVTTTTSDDVTLYGDTWFGELDESAPLILLFHQGGSDARGEYAEIAPWLNENGFRAIAWDLRSGGDRFGSANRTVESLNPDVSTEYCDGYPDLEAALDYVLDERLAESVIVWGSSYSGALVFQLAAARPDDVSALLAFSAASGGPMVDCSAANWMYSVRSPMAVYTPDREMEYPHVAMQAEQLAYAGARVFTVNNGVHGSSMLVDERTEHDMDCARREVLTWLSSVFETGDDK